MGSGPAISAFSGPVLRLTVFPALTLLSVYLIFGHLSEFETALRSQYCSPSSKGTSPYALPYTGFGRLDSELCFIVSVFHVALDDPLGYTFLKYFLGTSSIYVILPLLEALRPSNEGMLGKSLRWPASWIMMSEFATLGVTMTVWGLVVSLVRVRGSKMSLAVEGGQKQKKDGEGANQLTKPSPHDVLSIIPSVVIGAALPSYALLQYNDPKITVLWQIFPVYVFTVGWIYHCLANLSHSPSTTSVTNASQFILICSFLTSTYFHLFTVWPLLVAGDATSLQQLFLLTQLSPSTVESSVIAFLQYDFHFAWISALLITLLTVRFESVWHAARTIMVTSVGMVLVGPGATVAGIGLWKESRVVL